MQKPKKKESYKPTDMQVGQGSYYDLREIKGYNEGRADMLKYHKQVLTELASIHRIKMRFLSSWDMGQIEAFEFAKEISAMITEKLC